jgi:hypothetical protein
VQNFNTFVRKMVKMQLNFSVKQRAILQRYIRILDQLLPYIYIYIYYQNTDFVCFFVCLWFI